MKHYNHHTGRSNHSQQIASLLCCYLSTEIGGLYIQMPKVVLQGPVLSVLMESLSSWALFAVMSYGSPSTRVLCCGLQRDVIFVTSPPSPGLNCHSNFNIRIAAAFGQQQFQIIHTPIFKQKSACLNNLHNRVHL